jgi:heat shock 70kDa protein 1/2/6/8
MPRPHATTCRIWCLEHKPRLTALRPALQADSSQTCNAGLWNENGPTHTPFPPRCCSTDARAGVQVSDVVLLGGSSRVPRIQALFSDLFSGRKLNTRFDSDGAVACGAALQAARLSGQLSASCRNGKLGDMLLLNAIPRSLGLKLPGGSLLPVVPRNTTIPTKKDVTVCLPVAGNGHVDVELWEGEELYIDVRGGSHEPLGSFRVPVMEPPPPLLPQLQIEFEVDANSMLRVAVADTASGERRRMSPSNGQTWLCREDLDHMAAEAKKYVAEAAARRRFTGAATVAQDFPLK